MTLQTHLASASPPTEIDLFLFELSHPDWVGPLRYAEGFSDITVTNELAASVTFLATGIEASSFVSDQTGTDTRSFRVADLNLVLMRRLELLAGSDDPVMVKAYWYLSTDLTAPQTYSILFLSNPSRNDREVSFEAANINAQDREAPTLLFTYANSPGLRR